MWCFAPVACATPPGQLSGVHDASQKHMELCDCLPAVIWRLMMSKSCIIAEETHDYHGECHND